MPLKIQATLGFLRRVPYEDVSCAQDKEQSELTILPKPHGRSFAQQCRQSARHLRSCCCSCRREPVWMNSVLTHAIGNIVLAEHWQCCLGGVLTSTY